MLKSIFEYKHNNAVSYSCIVLDEKSRSKLSQEFPMICEIDGWRKYTHHMTICLGPLPDHLKSYLGESVELNIIGTGQSDLTTAFMVSGFESSNKTPHITACVNTEAGGKPKDSNNITNWTRLNSNKYTVTGIVTEVTF